MKEGFRQSIAWLHTWAGLVVGWLLFAIFLTGTASYFRPEISQWMRPELHGMAHNPAAASVAVAALQERAPNAASWLIDLPDERNPVVQVFWRDEGERRFKRAALDPNTGHELSARSTLGGEFFYRFHFELHMQPIWGRWIVGIAAMIMLIAIVSGVITHRRIFRDFFTFRPRKAGQRSWLDAHNATAVLALPFHLMITYSGLVILAALYMPWGIQAAYKGDQQAFFADVFPNAVMPGPRSGAAAPLAPVGPLLAEASRLWEGGRAGGLAITNPGDASARVAVTRHDGDQLSYRGGRIVFDGVSGGLIEASEAASPALLTNGVIYGLHLGRFAGPVLRWLFFLSGMIGTAMVATGLVLWVVKRRPAQVAAGKMSFGHRLVEGLNVGAVAGLPIAMAAFFWANRLLPADLAGRAEWEVRCFFGAWALAAIHPLLRPVMRAWREQLWAGAALFAALPVLNAATSASNLAATIARGDWVLAGFDLTALAAGLVLGVMAWKVGRWKPGARPARRGRGATAAAAPRGAEAEGA